MSNRIGHRMLECIIDDYTSGMSTSDIAKKYNRDETHVIKKIKSLNGNKLEVVDQNASNKTMKLNAKIQELEDEVNMLKQLVVEALLEKQKLKGTRMRRRKEDRTSVS